eukprot:SAG11_NODE_1385_length_5070_cov_3.950915_6_plen_140_part_00
MQFGAEQETPSALYVLASKKINPDVDDEDAEAEPGPEVAASAAESAGHDGTEAKGLFLLDHAWSFATLADAERSLVRAVPNSSYATAVQCCAVLCTPRPAPCRFVYQRIASPRQAMCCQMIAQSYCRKRYLGCLSAWRH